jgi:DnaK suppressor protein
MLVQNRELDKAFVEKQRQRLLERREQLEQMRRGTRETERERTQEYQDAQPDSGDQSQYIFEREMDATLGQQFYRELEDVNRALEKIQEGTYGLDDDTGEIIPRGRLEAIPEAIYTVENQQRRERQRRPPM